MEDKLDNVMFNCLWSVSEYVTLPNFMPIGEAVAEILRFFALTKLASES